MTAGARSSPPSRARSPPGPSSGSVSDVRFADAHTHLSMAAFQDDLPEVLRRAREAGVRRLITCATAWDDMAVQVSIAGDHRAAGVLPAAGIHPHQASQWGDDGMERLTSFVRAHPVAAIGEVGLDFHYSFSPHDAQRRALREQIRVARTCGLPLVIHCREARDDLAAIDR